MLASRYGNIDAGSKVPFVSENPIDLVQTLHEMFTDTPQYDELYNSVSTDYDRSTYDEIERIVQSIPSLRHIDDPLWDELIACIPPHTTISGTILSAVLNNSDTNYLEIHTPIENMGYLLHPDKMLVTSVYGTHDHPARIGNYAKGTLINLRQTSSHLNFGPNAAGLSINTGSVTYQGFLSRDGLHINLGRADSFSMGAEQAQFINMHSTGYMARLAAGGLHINTRLAQNFAVDADQGLLINDGTVRGDFSPLDYMRSAPRRSTIVNFGYISTYIENKINHTEFRRALQNAQHVSDLRPRLQNLISELTPLQSDIHSHSYFAYPTYRDSVLTFVREFDFATFSDHLQQLHDDTMEGIYGA